MAAKTKDYRRRLCERIAEHLTTADGLEAFRLMQIAGPLTLAPGREHSRHPASLPVVIYAESEGFRTSTRNVSLGGLGVTLRRSLETGSQVTVSFSLKGVQTVAACEVVWSTPSDEGQDLGLHFLSLAPEDRQRLAEFIKESQVEEAEGEVSDVASAEPDPGQGQEEQPEPIGPWKPQREDDEWVFVRELTTDELLWPRQNQWSDSLSLRQKKGAKRRICLIGESVAQGYFYAPFVTPAKLLEAALAEAAGPGEYEVIDVSKRGETPYSLIYRLVEVLQLAPDVIVCFAGNNFHFRFFGSDGLEHRLKEAEALAQHGVAGLLQLTKNAMRSFTEEALDNMAVVARSQDVPLVWVLPEANMADWGNWAPVHWLPGNGTAGWWELFRTGVRCLEEKDWAGAEDVARRMLGLDGGCSPTSHEMLARALEGQGRLEESRRAHLDEIEASCWDANWWPWVARIATTVRETIQSRCELHEIPCVNLSEVFALHSGSPLQGRRLFVEPNHNTIEGMVVAVAAAAAQVLRMENPPREVAWPSLVEKLAPRIDSIDDAICKFLTFLAQYLENVPLVGQKELAAWWCKAAIAADPSVRDLMAEYVAAKATRSPLILSRLEAVEPPVRRLNMSYVRPFKSRTNLRRSDLHLDYRIIEAICDAVEASGRPMKEEMIQLLLEHHGSLPVDISAFEYREQPFFDFGATYGESATFRSVVPWSTFYLVADATRDVELDLTSRLPVYESRRAGSVQVSINGSSVGQVELTGRWGRSKLKVARALLQRGVNRVRLDWPVPPPDGEFALAQATRRMEQGLAGEIYPVLGEVFSLVVRAA
jgi:hypothetical protein